MKTIIVATKNKGKLCEFKELLKDFNILSLYDVSYEKEIIENGTSFKENALIKARTLSKALNLPVIADDSGLEVVALNGEPGITSRRFSKEGTDEANNALLMLRMKGKENRSCRYTCAICIYFPNDTYKLVEEYCEGLLLAYPAGTNGFGYDPYFYSLDLEKSFGVASMSEKNRVSHRGKALRRLKELVDEAFSS